MKGTMTGVDLAKNVFQVHGASMTGQVKFRKKLSRPQFHKFMADHPPCVVVLKSCGGAHYWARQMVKLGHKVKSIAPQYVNHRRANARLERARRMMPVSHHSRMACLGRSVENCAKKPSSA